MEFLQPASLAEAIAAKAEHPAAVPIAGGTDVMVEINFDVRRPAALLDLNRVSELTAWQRGDGQVRLGAGVTYTRIIAELGALLPGLAMAARTVGSPQIRNRGTVGGNLGAASPAGDCHPVLLAAGASVEATSVSRLAADPGGRILHRPQAERPGPGRADHRGADPGRRWPPAVRQDRHQERDGHRRLRVRAGAAPPGASAAPGIGTGIGSAGPTPLRAGQAEEFLAGALAEAGLWESAASAAGPGRPAVRRAGRGRGAAHRRRARIGGLPPARAGRAGPADPDLGLAVVPRGRRETGMRVRLTVNGELATADDVWEGESLLFVLRERLALPGSKNACEQGECGSCTVLLDDVPVCACLVAAGQAAGREVVTVEGLAGTPAPDLELHPVQQAFIDAGAVQCGFCTPGLIVAAYDLLRRSTGGPADPDIREALAGNLCRCTGYEKILDAVRLAAARMAGDAA